jgi:hypothetical protein
MQTTKLAPETHVSILNETAEVLRFNAERMRMAHAWAIEYGWDSRPLESPEILELQAEKLDKLSRSLLRTARKILVPSN